MMSKEQNIITIDGPAGVGKSTVSRMVAAATAYTYLDTGAMYRAVGLYLDGQSVDLDDLPAVSRSLEELKIELFPAADALSDIRVLLNGEDVSETIRTPAVAMIASRVSALSAVRDNLTKMQWAIGKKGRVVAEGRDIGTVVFPAARYKFFLDALPEERARRRVEQLRARGVEVDEVEILAMTLERDRNDRERELAPLRQAEDAVKVDTTDISIDQVVEKILQEISIKDKQGPLSPS
ncbi:MAG: (d)CMP kinase [Deltaproteobacteria bacterium]|nr:(d)CMP kinase [Deltaproteobacteria bacterium]